MLFKFFEDILGSIYYFGLGSTYVFSKENELLPINETGCLFTVNHRNILMTKFNRILSYQHIDMLPLLDKNEDPNKLLVEYLLDKMRSHFSWLNPLLVLMAL